MTSSSPNAPDQATLRVYQVGFGDCFLLSFHYPDGQPERHALIDFGTTELPENAPKNLLRLVAEDIKKRCSNSGLDMVVATHRHADHICGFAGESGKLIADCKPKVVIQPWTEKPDAPVDAKAPVQSAERAFLSSLRAMEEIVQSVHEEYARLNERAGCSRKTLEQLGFLSAYNRVYKDPANMAAINMLSSMTTPEDHHYVHYGYPLASSLSAKDVLPGVKIEVLGPPTVEQSGAIVRQRSEDSEEFWQVRTKWATAFRDLPDTKGPGFWQLRLAADSDNWQRQAEIENQRTNATMTLFSESQPTPPHTRWFIRHLNAVRSEQLLEMVRIMDNALNNTSVILHFQFGDRALLFPGDAQIENWSYALKHPTDTARNEDLLRNVNLYKVGHHGSRNATPKTLWKILSEVSGQRRPDRLQSVVSTKAGKHGDPAKHTEVPRKALVEELRQFDYFSTQELGWNENTRDMPLYRDFPIK